MKRTISAEQIREFRAYLFEDEKSVVTVDKYTRDTLTFKKYVGECEVSRNLVLTYKEKLIGKYSVASVNSILAALNKFFRFMGWLDLCVKQLKVQKKAFCSAQKELSRSEYAALVRAAEQKDNQRLSLIIQTVCSTGIRISELSYVTLEAVSYGQATVSCKGKTRTVFIVTALRKKLLRYAKEQGIKSGMIFITKSGKAMNRCNIWREMKSLCTAAGVLPEKVFPHNLRHLFARTFYSIEKDIAKLADILGHSSINTTRIYIVTTGEEHRRRMENMRLIL